MLNETFSVIFKHCDWLSTFLSSKVSKSVTCFLQRHLAIVLHFFPIFQIQLHSNGISNHQLYEGKREAKKKGVKLERGEETFFMDRWRVETQNYTRALIFLDLPSQHREKKKTLWLLLYYKSSSQGQHKNDETSKLSHFQFLTLLISSCSKN